MKRTFLKVLPFAAALLLATSCSKDDNNSTDEIVNGGEQIETVTKTVKTLTIKGKVKQSISKVTTDPEGTALAFEGNEEFTFGTQGGDVYGTINIKDASGNYEATVNYTDAETLLSSDGFTATLGSNSEEMSTAYDDLATAVHNAYYVIPFKVVLNGDGSYLLRSRSLSKAEAESDILVYLQSAFIKALSAETTTLGTDEITVEADKYYVVPVGKAMGTSENNTLAGKIYNLGTKVFEFSVSATKKVAFSSGNLQYTVGTGYHFADNQYDYIGKTSANLNCTGTFDLFCWGTGDAPAQNQVTVSSFTDWGGYIEPDKHWYTLTDAEWTYIKGHSPNEWKEITVGGNTYKGLVILPDECTYVKTDIATTDWSELETAGAVFLPAAGYRDSHDMYDVGSRGYYWSAIPARGSNAQYFYFLSDNTSYMYDDGRYYGCSVRLVRSLQ